jgi:hypothetical protein
MSDLIGIGDDRLEGAAAIGSFLFPNEPTEFAERKARHLIRKKVIPTGHLAGNVFGSKQLIAARMARLASGEAS